MLLLCNIDNMPLRIARIQNQFHVTVWSHMDMEVSRPGGKAYLITRKSLKEPLSIM